MADRNRRFTVAAIALPVLLIAMAGLARANTIIVNTLDSGSQPFPLCTLEDAVVAANTQTAVNGCAGGTGNADTIEFIVTGTIFPDNTLTLNNPMGDLNIHGPAYGGITIDGQFNVNLIDTDIPSLRVDNLTFTEGNNSAGGAIIAGNSRLIIENCTFVDNAALIGGAVYASNSVALVLNDTFADNLANQGGAVFNADSAMFFTNDTFSGNRAQPADGADIFTELGNSDVNSSIFANSVAGGNCFEVNDFGYNISDDNTCGFSPPSVNNSTTLKLDPTGLQNNGGPTQTIALEAGSQAIDFTPIANCFAFPDTAVTNDQRLYTRPDPGNLNFCDTGAYEAGAVPPIVLAPNSERVQIARSSSPGSDQVNMAFTFTINGDPDCDADEDALNSGINVSLFGGTCASIPATGLNLVLNPFVVHTVNHESYGTLFEALDGPLVTVSARMVALPTPAGSCGAWALNLEVAGLDTPSIGLGGSNPFALVLTDMDGDRAGCFDITNAITGNQIPTPGHGVRRGVRRQTRR